MLVPDVDPDSHASFNMGGFTLPVVCALVDLESDPGISEAIKNFVHVADTEGHSHDLLETQ